MPKKSARKSIPKKVPSAPKTGDALLAFGLIITLLLFIIGAVSVAGMIRDGVTQLPTNSGDVITYFVFGALAGWSGYLVAKRHFKEKSIWFGAGALTLLCGASSVLIGPFTRYFSVLSELPSSAFGIVLFILVNLLWFVALALTAYDLLRYANLTLGWLRRWSIYVLIAVPVLLVILFVTMAITLIIVGPQGMKDPEILSHHPMAVPMGILCVLFMACLVGGLATLISTYVYQWTRTRG